MSKFKVQMINKYTEEVEEDFVDNEIFDDESDAEEYANYCNSCAVQGAEILRMSNPFDYKDEYGDEEDYEYVVVEME